MAQGSTPPPKFLKSNVYTEEQYFADTDFLNFIVDQSFELFTCVGVEMTISVSLSSGNIPHSGLSLPILQS